MTHAPKDIKSLVALVKTYHSRIVGLDDSSLTSIQRQQSEARLRNSLADEGITYTFSVSDYDSESSLHFSFDSLYIRDSSLIADVSPFGGYPIQLSVGESVSVYFEPRDISRVDSWDYSRIDNTRFANLRKGSSFDFSGRLVGCQYYPNRSRGSFLLRVDSEVRLPMLVVLADGLRKALWDGKPSGVDIKKR
jgi:hypothetical protein